MPHSSTLGETTPEIEIQIEQTPETTSSSNLNLDLNLSFETTSEIEEIEPVFYHYHRAQKIGQTVTRFIHGMANMSWWYPAFSSSSPTNEMVIALAVSINAIVDDISTTFSLRPLSHFTSAENPEIKKRLAQAIGTKLGALALTSLLALLLGISKKNFSESLEKNSYEFGTLLSNSTFGDPIIMIIEYGAFRLAETLGLKLWEYLSPSPEETFVNQPDLNSVQEGTRYFKRAVTDLAVLNYTNSYSISCAAWAKYIILVDASLKLANYFSFKINPIDNLDITHSCVVQCTPAELPLDEPDISPREISYEGGIIRALGYGIGALAAYGFATSLDSIFPNAFETHPYQFKIAFMSVVIGTDYLARNSKRLFSDIKTLSQKTDIVSGAITRFKNSYATFFNQPKVPPETSSLLVDPSKKDTFKIVL